MKLSKFFLWISVEFYKKQLQETYIELLNGLKYTEINIPKIQYEYNLFNYLIK
jgi:hypothetical protein